MSENKSGSFALGQVPDEMKRGWVAMFSVLVAIGVDLSSVLLGADMSNGMTMSHAIGSILVGSLISAVIYTICAVVGAKTSLSTSMITEFVFGKAGAQIFSLVIGVSLLGWFGVQVGFFAENARVILDHMLGITVSVKLLSLIGGLMMMSTAIVGYKAMEKLSVYSVPFLLILMLVTLFMTLKANGLKEAVDFKETMSFATGASLTMSIGIVGAIIAPDISRWSRSVKDSVLSSFFGILFGNSFMIIIAVVLIKSVGDSNLMKLFIALGIAVPGILVLTLAQWTTNTSNVYSSSLSFSVIFKKHSTKKISIVLGLIATGFAVLGIYNSFIDFLSLLGIIVAPVGGVYVGEYYVVKDQLANLKRKTVNIEMRSMAAWVVGIVVTYLATYNMLVLTTIPTLDGFMVGLIGQVMFYKISQVMKAKTTVKA